MPFIAGIGLAVAGAFGVGAISITTATVIGGAIVGAAVGGLYSAISGGNILKGVLFGAVGGAVLGYGVGALGFGGAASGTMMSTSTGQAIGAGSALSGGFGAGIAETSITTGAGNVMSGSLMGGGAAGGGGLFTTGNLQALGAIATLGNGFLRGGMQPDDSAAIESNERIAMARLEADERNVDKQVKAQLAAAGIAADATNKRTESDERIANANLSFSKEKFGKEFEELKWQDRKDREEKENLKKEIEQGIYDASEYAAGSTKVANIVEWNIQRKGLPSAAWATGQTTTQEQPVATTGAETGTAPATTAAPEEQQTGILGAA